MPRPHTLAEVARRRNAGEDFSFLLREFLDEFYGGVRKGVAAACIAEEPLRLPDVKEHASLGAIGEHLARRWNLPIPVVSRLLQTSLNTALHQERTPDAYVILRDGRRYVEIRRLLSHAESARGLSPRAL